jgi:hypothetical protein
MTDSTTPYLRSLLEYEPPVTDDLDEAHALAGRAWSPDSNVEERCLNPRANSAAK